MDLMLRQDLRVAVSPGCGIAGWLADVANHENSAEHWKASTMSTRSNQRAQVLPFVPRTLYLQPPKAGYLVPVISFRIWTTSSPEEQSQSSNLLTRKS